MEDQTMEYNPESPDQHSCPTSLELVATPAPQIQTNRANQNAQQRKNKTVRNKRNKRRRVKPNVNNDKENAKRKGAIELAIERINALQEALAVDSDEEDLSGSEDSDDDFDPDFASLLLTFDARALGYMACAKEAIQYLTDRGVPRDNPMMINLRNRLIQGINNM